METINESIISFKKKQEALKTEDDFSESKS